MAEKVASLYGELNLEDNMTPALKKAGGSLSSFTGGLKAAGQKVADFGGSLLKMSAPIVAGFGIAVSAAMGFDESLTNTAAVMGLTRDQTAALGDQLLQIGADSQAGPQAVADAYYDIAGAVSDVNLHMPILNQAIATAEAGNADLGATTRALTSIMNSYEFGAYDAAYASDVMTRTVGMGVGSMDDLAAAMPQVTGLAHSLGVSFEDLGTMMAYLSTKGNTFSESATQISAMMTAMIKPNQDMAAALKDLGYTTGQAAIDALGLQGAYQALVDAGHGDQMAALTGSVEALRGVTSLTTPVVTDLGDAVNPLGPLTREAATQIAGMRDALNTIPNVALMATGFGQLGTVMTTLPTNTKAASDNWLGLGDALWALPDMTGLANKFDLVDIATRTAAGGFLAFDEAFAGGRAGATESNREIQLTSLKAQMNDLTTDMEAFGIKLGLTVAPALSDVWEGLKPVIASIGDWVAKNPEAVATIGKLAAVAGVLGGALLPIGGLIMGIAGTLGVLTSPVGLATTLFLGLGTAIISVIDSWNNWQNTVRNTPKELLSPEGFSRLQAGLGQAVNPNQMTSMGGINPSILVNAVNAVTGKAGGGDFMAGQAITVGENGREVVRFGEGGRVFNRQQMRGAGGVSINGGSFVFNGVNDVQAFYDAMQQVARERSN